MAATERSCVREIITTDGQRNAEFVSPPHDSLLAGLQHCCQFIEADASERLRIAAVLHDIERAFPDREATWDSARDWDSPAYNRWHQDRCAVIAARWLSDQGVDGELVGGVERLIRVGGYVKLLLTMPSGDAMSVQMTKQEFDLRGIERHHFLLEIRIPCERATEEQVVTEGSDQRVVLRTAHAA